jgi:hypothetical protein
MADHNIVQNLSKQLRILGVCWLLYGLLRVAAGIWLIFFSNTATLMFGALLNRVPNPFAMMSAFHLAYGFLIAFSIVLGILGFLAGLSLLVDQRVGRTVTLLAAFLSLSSIPLGTTLGIYSLIVLLPVTLATRNSIQANRHSENLRGQHVTTT